MVLPGEIIEIAQDDDKSWLTLFYALPKELAEKYPDALKIPRSPCEVLYEGSYRDSFPEAQCPVHCHLQRCGQRQPNGQ